MKKKMQRVPDFSTKKPQSKLPGKVTDPPPNAPPVSGIPLVKPHSTSQKSGRRGS